MSEEAGFVSFAGEVGGVAEAPLKARLEDYERSLILEALSQTGGNQRRAARLLGILPTTLHEKMKRLGIPRPGGASPGAGD
jgi:DNA-binding NtrC family response regulator